MQIELPDEIILELYAATLGKDAAAPSLEMLPSGNTAVIEQLVYAAVEKHIDTLYCSERTAYADNDEEAEEPLTDGVRDPIDDAADDLDDDSRYGLGSLTS